MIGVALILLISGVMVYKHYNHVAEIAKQRSALNQTEIDANNFIAELTGIAKPDSIAKQNHCDYTSNFNEVEKGDLVCSIAISVNYQVGSRDDAANLANLLSQASTKSEHLQYRSSSSALSGTTAPEQLLRQGFIDKSGLECSMAYMYYNNQDSLPSDLKASNGKQSLLGALSCFIRPAATNYY